MASKSLKVVKAAWSEFNRLTAAHPETPDHDGWADCWCDQAAKIREAADALPSLRETLEAR